MNKLYRTPEGERVVRERYQAFLNRWPVPNQQLRIPTRQGETFVVASGDEHAPPVLLFHGSVFNSAAWMADVILWSERFRVYAVDMIGEAGLSAPTRPKLNSEAYALWLDEVLNALNIPQASLVGMSLGGWLALDYATRRPRRVESLVVMNPAGICRQKFSAVLKAIALQMCGPSGAQKARDTILGRIPQTATPAIRAYMEFVALIQEHFRPRLTKLPIFTDEALHRLTMPVMAILGGQDALLDAATSKRRLEQNVQHADIRYLPEASHVLPKQTAAIAEFLNFKVPA